MSKLAREDQRAVRLAVSTDGGVTYYEVDSTNPLPVTSVASLPGTGATSLGKAEDAAHASGDVGVMMLAVRKDTAAALAGTDVDYIPLIVDANGRLHTAPGAGENHLGQVGGEANVVSQTLILDTSAYAIGDVLSVPAAVAMMRVNSGTAVLESLVVTDEDDQGFGLDLYFFDSASASLGTINGAVSISDADARSLLGRVQIAAADFTDLGGVRVAFKMGIGLLLKAVAGAQTVYVGTVAQGAGTYTASGIRVRYGLLQN
jgi:hypothetical protein